MFDLELDRVVEEIKKRNVQQVLLQLPDGLKPRAQEIVERIHKDTTAEALIWFGSCFGHCDVPLGMDALKIDFIVQFGHNRYHKTAEGW